MALKSTLTDEIDRFGAVIRVKIGKISGDNCDSWGPVKTLTKVSGEPTSLGSCCK